MDPIIHELYALEHDARDSEIEQLLLQLHDLTKRTTNISPIVTDEKLAMTTLGHFAFSTLPRSSQPALRCLHNMLYLVPPMRQVFVDLHYPEAAVVLIKNHDAETAAIAMLMLCRLGDTTFDYSQCLEDVSLADKVHQIITCEAETATPPSSRPASPLNASLLFLTTIATHCKRLTGTNPVLKSQQPILQLLCKTPILSPPLQPPLSLLMHAVGVALSDDTAEASSSLLVSKIHVDKVVEVLFRAMQVQGDTPDFETVILPPVEFLCSLANSCESDIRQYLVLSLLPSEQDRLLVLGEGSTLPHLLIKVGVEASRPELKFLLAKLFFELSGNNPHQLITNVGFGCAAGLLSLLKEPVPDTLATQGLNSEDVNLVTGQRRDAEAEPESHDWTDEEKQREAERLFVLFERLKAAGVGVENPVHQATREGRFSELED